MNIKILQLIEGAKQAKGLTVVIDVFRAMSVEAYLLSRGAEKIIPVGDANLAYKLKEENPTYILAGERHGKIMPGFDLGNSPDDVLKTDVKGKTVVHTTSAGTQGIANATGADEILGASLVNARATAKYIAKSGYENVSIVCMGLEALSPTEEDTLCAEYIKAIVEGKESELDMKKEIESLKTTSGAKFFDKAQNDVFPENDFYLSTDLDKFDFVIKLSEDENGMKVMKKVEL
ncbi:MAG: 2-phosphosulfolactate phosphatase [Clostridia bacterium]|nr:2-phosphosulfolactate phosphatase [Clostridia bacterium]